MKRTEKEQLVSELKDKIDGAKALYFTDFTGLNVKRMTDLRRRFARPACNTSSSRTRSRCAQ
jgi:large subunit ribosomal protein L10